MSREEILSKVREKLQSISGVVEVLIMDENVRSEVFRLETIADSNGACGGHRYSCMRRTSGMHE